MELRHLRYFAAAAQEEHFGRAAERLHVTRPAVSKIIFDLEEELGIALFERIGHRVKLTEAGQMFLAEVQVLMASLKDAVTKVKNVGAGKHGSLSIGYGALALLHPLFLDAVKEFRRSCPDVSLSLFEMATSAQPKALADGKIDGGFMHLGPDVVGSRKKKGQVALAHADTILDWLRIQSCGLAVAVPRDHKLAKKKSVSLAQLADESFVVVSRADGSVGYGLPLALCHKAGFEPRIVQEVNSITSQLNLVLVGMGIGVVPIGRNYEYPERLAVIPIEDVDYPITSAFGWVRGRKSPTLDRMIDIVKSLAPP